MPINCFDTENGVAGFSQRDYKTGRHSHFAIELAFSLTGCLAVTTPSRKYSQIQAVIIGSNVVHTFSCLGGECQLYFFDPTGTTGEEILKDYEVPNQDLVVLETNDAEKLKERCNVMVSKSRQEGAYSKQQDDRIKKCLAWIERNKTLEGINLSMLSETLFLSESRLAHLFKAHVGISVHQYILWKKIETATQNSLEGHSLTECAHFAGFTDSSHFNKTFKKMFGVKPSFVLKR